MRVINSIIIHCTDSDVRKHDHDALFYLRRWHVEENGWSDIGYHYIISKKQGLLFGRPIDRVGSHCRGRNSYSIGIVLCGKSHFSDRQMDTLKNLVLNQILIFNIPTRNIHAHKDFSPNKTCPNFDIEPIRRWCNERRSI